MSIVVTGGAGFIGSCLVRTLNDRGIYDIIIVDDIASTEKWMNIRNKRYREYVHKSDFITRLDGYGDITAIFHMGAQSSTTEKDFEYLKSNNFEYTRTLWQYCAKHNICFIYASSAATYGDGSLGFDDKKDIDDLLPLNAYGYSKQMFDMWVKYQAKEFPKQYAGLKFFNVYGPNEYFKGSMASMLFHGFWQIQQTGTIRLFKSCNPDYADGGQMRDFIYVKDVCKVMMWFMDHPEISGLYNVGTGHARTFADLASAVYQALDLEPDITYIDMPKHLRKKYQYFTQADVEKLYHAGYDGGFTTLEDAAADYVKNYLAHDNEIY